MSDYGFGDRILHRLALSNLSVCKMSFEFDGLISDKGQYNPYDKHVFICGLARAGTTILLRMFYDTGQFRSLTYRDMPFVLMPVIWKRVSNSFYLNKESRERVHGDGIYVDFDSPEAFEEVFWRTFCGSDYILDNCLKNHTVNKDLLDQFRIYIRRILSSSNDRNQLRYLSKNNNNILRLGTIRKAFSSALIIIPFRDPIQQSISLLNQHKKFCEIHSYDHFSCDYMSWLGHHEFGATHKPFCFENETDSLAVYKIDDINYWLTIWLNTYSHILNNVPSKSIFLCYEDMCEAPVETIKYLFKSADLFLDEDKCRKMFNTPQKKETEGIDESLRNRVQQIYLDLRALAR